MTVEQLMELELTVASAGTTSSTAYKPILRNSVKTQVNSSDGLNYLKQKFLKLNDNKTQRRCLQWSTY
jgi:hypothetical protein